MCECLGIKKMVSEINRLNPGVYAYTSIYSSLNIIFFRFKINPKTLKLPEGYYYNEKNGITNKHNTKSGSYESFSIHDHNDFN